MSRRRGLRTTSPNRPAGRRARSGGALGVLPRAQPGRVALGGSPSASASAASSGSGSTARRSATPRPGSSHAASGSTRSCGTAGPSQAVSGLLVGAAPSAEHEIGAVTPRRTRGCAAAPRRWTPRAAPQTGDRVGEHRPPRQVAKRRRPRRTRRSPSGHDQPAGARPDGRGETRDRRLVAARVAGASRLSTDARRHDRVPRRAARPRAPTARGTRG